VGVAWSAFSGVAVYLCLSLFGYLVRVSVVQCENEVQRSVEAISSILAVISNVRFDLFGDERESTYGSNSCSTPFPHSAADRWVLGDWSSRRYPFFHPTISYVFIRNYYETKVCYTELYRISKSFNSTQRPLPA